MKQGDCLLIETGRRQGGSMQAHLFVVLLDPSEHNGNTIIVSVESLRSERHDRTTVLRQGDHEFIRQESYVNYSRAAIVSVAHLEGLIQAKSARMRKPFREELVAKIRSGISKSRFTPLGVVELYEDSLFGAR